MLTAGGLCACAEPSAPARTQAPKQERSLFSWHEVEQDEVDVFLQPLERGKVTALFQALPEEEESRAANRTLIAQATRANIEVYALMGDPDWALEEDGASIVEAVQWAADWNAQAAQDERLQGVVLDVEPYLTEQWDQGQTSTMDRYVSVMEKAYRLAADNGLECVVCIPFFYDTKGHEKALERLIGGACDTVAVMNYYQDKEIDHIAGEMALAEQAGKRIISIYELQKAGDNGVTEKNTYHEKGLGAVEQNWQALQQAYPYAGFSMAWHEYDAYEALAGDE